jgi:NADH-quinone oxidoreductase subunit L
VPGHGALYAIAVGTAGVTAFYMCRLHFRTFLGKSRASEETLHHVHEPATTVIAPLVVLALLSVFGGFLGAAPALNPLGTANFFSDFLNPLVHSLHHEVSHAEEIRNAMISTAVALGGFALAWLLYVVRPELPAAIRRRFGALHRLVANKYYVDEAYDAVLVKPVVGVSEHVLYEAVDAGFIDGALVNGTAGTVKAIAGDVLKYAQAGLAQAYLALMAAGAVWVVWRLVA